jgi:hypothetical protein
LTDTATSTPVVQVGSGLALDTVARVLGGGPEPLVHAEDQGNLLRYDFPSLTAVLVFAEVVDGRGDVYRTTHPTHIGTTWRVYVAPRS